MATARDQLVNTRLGDFDVLRELGRGGMGVVYEARQVSLNRKVALKVLAGHGLTVRGVQRFHREAEAAAQLHHTNIVPVYATGESEGIHFYAMELVDGPSLDHVIRDLRGGPSTDVPFASSVAPPSSSPMAKGLGATGPYHEAADSSSSNSETRSSSALSSDSHYFDSVARMIAEVADALEYAHQHGVIHRDVKPSNLLLSPEGRLSLNDFGLARVLEQPGMTITGEFVGTPAYMSPEQITAGRVPIDHRTDVYSLGATLYELLTLRQPFSGGGRDQVLAQILQKEPKAPRRVNRKIPLDLETICLKSLEKDPDRRYLRAGEMAEDLRRYLSRFAILARRAGPLARVVKWARRRPGLAAALVAVVLIACVAGIFAYRAHVAEQQRLVDRQEHERELAEEKLRSVLERGMLSAREGDYDTAEAAVREAEKLGSSAGQLRMLRGQIAFHRGQMEDAIRDFEQAVTLLPDSVAARSLLAVAYAFAGKHTHYERALREANELTPVTPEDFLFLGHAECQLDTVQGLKTLDEAVRRRPSTLARLLRADALSMQLQDAPHTEQAELAMQDAAVIRRHLPKSYMALRSSFLIHLSAVNVFAEAGDTIRYKIAFERAEREAEELAHYNHLPDAVMTRALFYRHVNRDEVVLEDLRRAAEKTDDDGASFSYGVVLHLRGEFGVAAAMLAGHKDRSVQNLLRIVCLTELSGQWEQVNKACDELDTNNLNGWDAFNAQLLLRYVGRKQEAVAVCQRLLAQPERQVPIRRDAFRKALEYGAGKLSAAELLASIGNLRGDLCNAHLSIALTYLADGNRKEAKEHFRRSVATHMYQFFPYSISQIFLKRMEQDPRWPPWIPLKE